MLICAVTLLLSSIALLAVPITLSFRVSWRETLRREVVLRWAFFAVRLKPSPRARVPGRESEGAVQARGSSGRTLTLVGMLRQTRLRRRLARFIGDLWCAIRKRDLSLRVRIGLDDPAATGELWGILGPIAGALATIREASIMIEPEFLEPGFELDTSGTVRFVPLRLLSLTLALLLSPLVWLEIVRMRSAR